LTRMGSPHSMGRVNDGRYAGSLLGSTSSQVNCWTNMDISVMASMVANCCPRLMAVIGNSDL